jgi:hypothetical protein
MSNETLTPSLFRRVIAVAVGLFAIWQFIYLPASNVIIFVPRRLSGPGLEPVGNPYQAKGTFTSVKPIQRAAECTGDVLDFWSEATAQEQGWVLFALGPPPYSVFPAVEFHFADGQSDTVLSQFEPLDKLHPQIRPPLVNNRVLNYEAQLTTPVTFVPPEELAKRFMPPEEYRRMVESHRDLPDIVSRWRRPFRAWLVWQTKRYTAVHPERGTPTVAILKHRYIPTPLPGTPAEWTQPPVERPFARWYPATDVFEAYNVADCCFVPVGAKP